jgi:hypothetical protein
MTKIEQMLAAGIPVVSQKSDETIGKYTFSEQLSPEQVFLFGDIASPPDYAELRRREYPPLSELADAIYWQENGDKEPMKAYIKKCTAVKDKYPKPG